MLLSLFVIIFIGLIAYWHFLQGFFSSAISAIIAIIAALVALGYQEDLVALSGGKFDDYANALAIVVLFAFTYLILRVIFDKAIPGNVRFPVLLDKIGAPIMGVIAGIFAVGVLIVAAQTLPFAPSIAGHERYPIAYDKTITLHIEGKNQQQDAMYDELDAERFVRNDAADASGLWVSVDEMVLGLLKKVSAPDGALFNGQSFAEIHPDYLQELFGQRIGLQSGSNRTASAGRTSVQSLHLVPSLMQTDQERYNIGGSAVGIRGKGGSQNVQPLDPQRVPDEGKVLLVVRTRLSRDDADKKSGMVAFSPATVRLVGKSTDTTTPRPKNYFPIGTLEAGRMLFYHSADDYLFVPGDKFADLVFEVDEEGVFLPLRTSDKGEQRKVAPGVFLEVKRHARVWLAGMQVQRGIERNEDVAVVRKHGGAAANYAPPSGGGGGGTAANSSPLTFEAEPKIGARMFTAINVGSASENERSGLISGGEFSLQNKKFSKLNLAPAQTIALMARGDNLVGEFAVPPGNVMIQVPARLASSASKWAWAGTLGDFRLVDSANKRHLPYGAIAKVVNNQNQEMLAAVYDMTKPQGSLADPGEGFTPVEITLLYLVPSGANLKSLDFKEELIRPMELKAQ